MTPHNDLDAFALLSLAIVTLGYLATCVIWPFKACRRCAGTGKLRSPVLRAIRLCPQCDASGLRLRFGRRVWNAYQRLPRDRRDRHR
jgi:hypothetical protein